VKFGSVLFTFFLMQKNTFGEVDVSVSKFAVSLGSYRLDHLTGMNLKNVKALSCISLLSAWILI